MDALLRGEQISDAERKQLSPEEQDALRMAEKMIASRHDVKPYRMEFKDMLLRKILRKAVEQQEKKKKQRKHLFKLVHVKSFSAAGVLMVAIALVIAFTHYTPSALPGLNKPGQIGGIMLPVAHAHDNFTLEPESVDALGVVRPDSSFILTSKTSISAGDLKAFLSFGGTSFSIKTIERGTVYRIEPEEQLERGGVTQVRIASLVQDASGLNPYEYAWAFEIQDHFKVMGSTPADQSSYIPVDTAVRINVSHTNTKNAADYVSIEPAHPFKIEEGYRTFIIVPERPWEKNTVYTVRLRAGFGVAEEYRPENEPEGHWELQEDYVIQFATNDEALSSGAIWFHEEQLGSQPGQGAELVGYHYGTARQPVAQVRVFALNEEMTESVLREISTIAPWIPSQLRSELFREFLEDQDFASPVQQYELASQSSASYQAFYALRPIANEGVYLLAIEVGGGLYLMPWIVSPAGMYAAITENDGLVWAVDVEKGETLAQASVYAFDTLLGTTNADGVLELTQEQIAMMQEQTVLFVRTSAYQSALPIRLGRFDQREIYNGFVTLDQYLAHPDDTVRYWGFVQRQDGEMPSEVEIELVGWRDSVWNGQVVVASEHPAVNDLGFFSGDLDLTHLAEGYYSLNVNVNGQSHFSKSIDVREFSAPEIALSMEPEKQRVDAGEDNFVTLRATLFDGKPAAFMEFRVRQDEQTVATVQTDGAGMASFVYPSEIRECLAEWGCSDEWVWLSAEPVEALGSDIAASVSWMTTQEYLHFDLAHEVEDGSVLFTAHVQGLNYLTSDEPYPPQNKIQRFHAAGVPFRATVVEISSELSSALMSEYDEYTNTTRYYYEYTRKEQVVDRHEGLTDEQGRTHFTFTPQPERNYEIRFEAMDAFERYDSQTEYISFYELPYGRVYVENPDEEIPVQVATPPHYQPHLTISHEKAEDGFQVGDIVKLQAKLNSWQDAAINISEDTLFFVYALAPSIEGYKVTRGATADFLIEDRHRPSFTLAGAALIDGRIYYTYPFFLDSVTVDQEPYRLDVNVQTGADAYGRGDEVNAEIQVKDAQGKPVRAEVNISVLDRAYLELDQYAAAENPLTELWSGQYHRLRQQAATHHPPYLFEGGGGGGGDVRSEFLELAHYEIVQTDANGYARISFRLPDNVTTWAILAKAATSDRKGGLGIKDVVVAQPLQVEVIANDQYLAEDSIVLSARSYADFLHADDDVQYAFYGPLAVEAVPSSLADFPVADQLQTVRLTEHPQFAIGQLKPGLYAYAIRATAQERQDIVIKSFMVRDSYATRREAVAKPAQEGLPQVPEEAKRIDVSFSSSIGADAYRMLTGFSAYGTRLDGRVAQDAAAGLLKQYFGVDHATAETAVTTPYKVPNGGFTLYPFGEADLERTSALLPLLDDQEYAPEEMAVYFASVLSDEDRTLEETALAFRGLAALQKPGLAQLQQFAHRDDLNVQTILTAADALLLYGDVQTARSLFARAIDLGYQEEDGRAWITAEDAETLEIRAQTELAMLVAAQLQDARAELFYAYLLAQSDKMDPAALVRYWKAQLAHQPVADMRFVVRAGEEERFVTLRGYESFTLSLSRDDYQQLSLEDVQGPLYATAAYEIPFTDAVDSSMISASRMYRQNGRIVESIDPSLPVEVEIVVSLKNPQFGGGYLVEDILPSGLQGRWRGLSWMHDTAGQRCTTAPYRLSEGRMNAHIWLGPECSSYTVRYRAMAVAEGGSYVAEGVSVTGGEHEAVALRTPRQRIEINE